MKHNRITTILLAVALLFFLSFCASTDDDDDDDDDKKTTATTTTPDTTAPTVTGRTPSINATKVPLSTNVTVTFNKGMTSASINGTNFTLTKSDNTTVSANVTYSNKVATLDPKSDLSVNSTYTAKIAGNVTDSSGNQLGNDYSWNFTTIVENVSPTVTSKTPDNGTTDVAASPTFTVKFSEKLDNTTVSSTRFTLMDSNNNTKSLKNYNYDDNLTVTFQPNSDLSANTKYTASVTAGIKDLNGNALTPLSWEFTTAKVPTVTVKLPADGTTDFEAKNTNVIVVFSEQMDTTTLNSTFFFVATDSTNQSGTRHYSLNDQQAMFNSTNALVASKNYTVTVLNSAKSKKGYSMTQNETFNFVMKDIIVNDDEAPTVIFSPIDGSNGVAKSANVTLTFDKDMNPATVNDNVVLKLKNEPFTAVGYSFSFNNGKVFTLNPSANLTAAAEYTVSLNSSVLDLSGNSLNDASADFQIAN